MASGSGRAAHEREIEDRARTLPHSQTDKLVEVVVSEDEAKKLAVDIKGNNTQVSEETGGQMGLGDLGATDSLRSPEQFPKRPQDSPRSAPSGPRDGPRELQNGLERPPRRPKRTPRGPQGGRR